MRAKPCPNCGASLDDQDVNIKEGVALCRGCSTLVSLSALAVDPATDLSAVNIEDAPEGCWYSDTGVERVVGATNRSGVGCFLLFGAIFWNGIVSVFIVQIALRWLSVLRSRPGSGGPGLGGLVGETLFLVPFVLVGLLLIVGTLYFLFGKIELTIRDGRGTLFRGVGTIGRRNRFEIASAKDVSMVKASWQQNDQPVYQVQIGTSPPIKFGSTLIDERKKWFAATAHDAIVVA